MQWRGRLAQACAALLALGLAGCSQGGGGGGSAGATKGVTLNVLLESGGYGEQQAIAQQWESQTGNKVNFIQAPYAGVFDKLSAEAASKSGAYDVATVDEIWLPTFGSLAMPLDSMFTPDVKSDLFPSLVTDAQQDGHFVGMPVWANAEILYYRKDLFGSPTEQAAFKAKYGYDLNPPQTWQQFRDAAEFFTRKDASGKTTLYGTDIKGAVETEWLALTLQAGSQGVVLDQKGKSIIDNQAHQQALQYDADLNCKDKATPPSVTNIDWNAAQNLFNQGQTAMMLFWGHAYRLVPKDAPVYGKVGVAPMIAGSAGVGAIPGPWYNMIPSSSKHQAAAQAFVKFGYDHNALALQSSLGLAARKSAFASVENQPGFENIKPLMDTLAAKQTLGRPKVKDWQQIVDNVLVPTVQKTVSCQMTASAALSQAKQQLNGMGH
jgi:multiple sugar transport system substrate-binding protein